MRFLWIGVTVCYLIAISFPTVSALPGNHTVWTLNSTLYDEYLNERYSLVSDDAGLSFSSDIVLSSDEQRAGVVLKAMQEAELARTLEVYPFQYSFFHTRPIIDSGDLIDVLRAMPKGAALHEHLPSASSYNWFIDVATYRDDSYIFFLNDTYYEESYASHQNGTFRFFNSPPSARDGVWWLTNDLRAMAGNVTAFDQALLEELTIVGKDFGDYYQIWDKFDAVFSKVSFALNYLPVFQGFMLNMFQTYVDNGVQHLELREGGLDWALYDLDGNKYNPYQEVIDLVHQFQSEVDPDFSVRIVYAVSRWEDRQYVAEALTECVVLMERYPELIVGFDLQGAEDEGHSLLYFSDILLPFKDHVPFFFHAGESLEPNNTNLYDAVLLGSKRIGHGYAVRSFPTLFEEIRERDIGIELNPISNQLLGLVHDMRNHAGHQMMQRGLPVTISSDDPGIYNYDGTTYDFYMAYMAWALNIRDLKQLAINSLTHSGLTDFEQQSALAVWSMRWDSWIQDLLADYDAFYAA